MKYTVNIYIADLEKGKKKYLWLDKWEQKGIVSKVS